MKIYKIRGWVNGKANRKGILPSQPFHKEIIVVGWQNKPTAKAIFEVMKNEIKTFEGYRNYISGHCQFFEPYIFDNGTLADWPDNEKYIDKYEF